MLQFDRLLSIFRENKVESIYLKELAENDNSKNQIYLGGSFDILQNLPFGELATVTKGDWKRHRFIASFPLYWVEMITGEISFAPNAKLILYPKYPEVRLSGFVKGCPTAPNQYMRSRREIEDRNWLKGRVLVLGVSAIESKCLAYLAIEENFEMKKNLFSAKTTDTIGALYRLNAHALTAEEASILEITTVFKEIHQKGWIKGKRLSKRGEIPYSAPNAGGYTLEAELNIFPNADATPDYKGWEVKQFTVQNFSSAKSKPLTLMTPEPDGGLYNDNFNAFMEKFALPDKTGNKLYFSGMHKFMILCEKTQSTISLQGYDFKLNAITDVNGGIFLSNLKFPNAASWSFSKLITIWSKKHNKALYVPSMKSTIKDHNHYWYGPFMYLGIKTSFEKFLFSFINAMVYYDPGTSIDIGTGKQKRRNQFRIKAKHLDSLYYEFITKKLI